MLGLNGPPGLTAPSHVSPASPTDSETVPIRGHRTEETTVWETKRMSRNALFSPVQVSDFSPPDYNSVNLFGVSPA